MIYFVLSILTWIGPSIANQCSEIHNRDNGEITSPKYPVRYDSNLDLICTYKINDKRGETPLIIPDYHIQWSLNCVSDSLKIYSGNSTHANSLLIKICGSYLRKKLVWITDEYVTIHFRTNENAQYKGFKLIYGYSHVSGYSKYTCNGNGGIFTGNRAVVIF